MFQSYFQLQRRPFSSVPACNQYFAASAIESARTSLVRLIERREGPGIVIANIGLGKSLLCQLLAESFRHRCRTISLPSGRLCTRRALLQVILYELGLPYRDLEEGELRLSLIDHVTNAEVCPQGVVLLVDEADQLSMALLDELRSMTNLSGGGEPCVRLVLFGTPRLEEKFAHPRLESFNQRLAGRFYLQALTADETAGYVTQQFEDSGGTPEEVFTTDALTAIHSASEGIPRLINQLTDHALILATANGLRQLDADCVAEAWADLQQLPTPGRSQNVMAAGSEVPGDLIEFGELAESDDTVDRAETQLDTIAAQMELVDAETTETDQIQSADTESDQFPTLIETEPEVTLYFHEAHDPFGNDFEEEEIVVDHFVSPDALSQRHRRQVSDADSQQLADHLDAVLEIGGPQIDADANNDLVDFSDEHTPSSLRLAHQDPTDSDSVDSDSVDSDSDQETIEFNGGQGDTSPTEEADDYANWQSQTFNDRAPTLDEMMTSGAPLSSEPFAEWDASVNAPMEGQSERNREDRDLVAFGDAAEDSSSGDLVADKDHSEPEEVGYDDSRPLEHELGLVKANPTDSDHGVTDDAADTDATDSTTIDANEVQDPTGTKAPKTVTPKGNYRRLFTQLRARRA